MKNKINKRKQTPFWNLYKGELKKTVFLPFLIGIIIVYLILLLITHGTFYSFVQEYDKYDEPQESYNMEDFIKEMPDFENFDAAYLYVVESASLGDGTYIFKNVGDIDKALSLADKAKKEIDKEKKEEGIKFYVYHFTSDPYYALRLKVNTLKEIKAKHMNKRIKVLSNYGGIFSMFATGSTNYYDFYKMASSMLIGLITVYGVVIAARSYSTEFRSGTIKILMVRPITRNQLTTAKLCATVTNVTFVYVVVSLLTFFTSLKYQGDNTLTLFSFNAGAFTLAPAGMMVFYIMLLDYLTIISWVLFSFAVSTLSKHLVTGIVSYLFLPLIGTILHLIGLDVIDISTNMSWSPFLGGNEGPTPTYGNFFITLVFWTIYVIGSTVLTYYVVNKRDLA